MSNLNDFLPGTSFKNDTNSGGGAIDITKGNHFLQSGNTYTLADGNNVGQKLNFMSTSGSGGTSITVANAVRIFSGNPQNETNFSWNLHNTGESIRFCIWDGTRWVLDNNG